MSLYTPVFPELNGVQHLRDLHLFLSTQSDTLSPPSRPNSPLFDSRVQKAKEKIVDIFDATEGNGKWTRVSQALKLGCVRGRHWSLPQADPCPPEQNPVWILPDEESLWIEWEKKREQNRQLKTATNVSLHIDDPHKPVCASVAGPSRPRVTPHYRGPPGVDVSPTTLHAAKEKVRKWQASMVWRGSSPTAGVEARPQRSRTLDFAVVKPVAKAIVAKKSKSLGSVVRGNSAPIPSHKSKLPSIQEPSRTSRTEPVEVNKVGRPTNTRPAKDPTPKIVDVPESLYFPPSFSAQLETSTPLPVSKMIVRTKPPPILPVSSSTPPPSTPADPPDRQFVLAEPHVADVAPTLPPQINAAQPGKRSRAPSALVDHTSVTPPAKRPRTHSQDISPAISVSQPMSPNGVANAMPCIRDEVPDPNPGTAQAHQHGLDTVDMELGVPSTPGRNDQPVAHDIPEKLPSPTKSVRSYFSAPDSDGADSPMKGNLLLESPVSPMLSYAQNPSVFLPQVTSTQARKRSSTPSRTNNGMLEMGFSSQFDVERHVDRVSEMLEKDVDFEGWLRDVRTVEMSQD